MGPLRPHNNSTRSSWTMVGEIEHAGRDQWHMGCAFDASSSKVQQHEHMLGEGDIQGCCEIVVLLQPAEVLWQNIYCIPTRPKPRPFSKLSTLQS
eukprot:3302558-Amphidinium_carterae.1